MTEATTPVLQVDDLRTHFFTQDGVTRAVDGVSFQVKPGETLGIVGESGCGKSVTALSILRLLPARLGRTVGGSIRFEGQELLSLGEGEMRDIRGNRIAMIFQEPMTSLNPVLTIGDQIAEAVMIHQGKSRAEAMARAIEMLRLVRIPDPERRVQDYPHQFSGGMRQRAMIAMALSCNPRLLIADEPTTAIDVTTQAQVLALLRDLRARLGTAIVFITHDLGVIAQMASYVVVMYLGRVMEQGPVDAIFHAPKHPYTRALLRSMPHMHGRTMTKLPTIEGALPHPFNRPAGCPFHPRCPDAIDACRASVPELAAAGDGQMAACLVHAGGGA